jgi:hypothetical protein
MSSFFNIPFVQILLLPFFCTVVLISLLRLMGPGIKTANAAVGTAFAWVCAFILGSPDFPPAFNSSAILSATVSLLAIGMILDLSLGDKMRHGRLIETITLILSCIGVTIWMRGGIDLGSIPIFLGCGAVLFSLQRVANHKEFGSGMSSLLLFLIAGGLGIIAWISNITADRDLAFGLSSISFGFFAWNYPKPKLLFGHGVLLAGGGGLYMIAVRLIEQSPSLIPTLIILGFIFFADNAVQHFPNNFKLSRSLPISIKFLSLALIPLMLAIIAAVISNELPVN